MGPLQVHLKMRKALVRGVRATMMLVERETQINLHGKVLHRRSGRLASSIRTEVQEKFRTVVGRIGTNVFYGRIWELEGRPSRGIPPRPFMRPAAERMTPFGREIVAAELSQAAGGILKRRVKVKL